MTNSTKKSSKEGRRLHSLAEKSREAGKFLEALEYTDQASLAYQKDGDLLGLAEVQSSRQSTFKHLFRSTGDDVFLILEKHSAQAAVDIAEESGIVEALAIPFHNLGKYYSEVKDYAQAAWYFKKAVENLKAHPQNPHSRPAVITDIAGHLYWAQYHLGDKTALQKALAALEKLKFLDEESYNKAVWITGAQLRIAEMTNEDDPQLAREHLEAAREIINDDDRLILRAEQLKALEADLF